jgi:gluconate 5-dehydrogenase
MNRFDLTGTVALVTGSTRGLGNVIAGGLADSGATVVLNGRDGSKLDEVVASFLRNGRRASGKRFDVTDEAAVEHAVDEIERDVGPIGVLVNNVGIQDRGPLEEFSTERFRRVVETNLTAAFVVARSTAVRMIARGEGKIVNVCSLMSEVARPTTAPYAAAKGGLKMLTRAMAAEWASKGLQVNAIGPGYFLTDMTRPLAQNTEFDSWVKSRTPAGRWGDPEELIGAAVFLSSKASSFVNGQIIYVDGGMLSVL